MRDLLKQAYLRLTGKQKAPVVVSFLTGDPALALRMLDQVRQLLPDYRHFAVGAPADAHLPGGIQAIQPEQLRPYRIGMAAVLFDGNLVHTSQRWQAFRLAPTRILAFNSRLERHHLKLSCPLASWLFLRGVPLDRIWLRPRWLWPWRRDRTEYPTQPTVLEGRPLTPGRPRVAIVSPYFPWPLAHGGAVRIYHLMREASQRFDLFLFAFYEPGQLAETKPVLDLCARAVLFPMPRYREPRWSTLDPPEVREFDVPALEEWLRRYRREYQIRLTQVEYTHLATTRGDILVEHDVTFDLFRQAHERLNTWSSRWNLYRWKRFEESAIRRYRAIVTMSEKDSKILDTRKAITIANGVDLQRFHPVPEQPGFRLLFIGSFRHLPNIVAYRYFTEQVWPLMRERDPRITLEVVAGPDPEVYWRGSGQPGAISTDPRIQVHGFIRDVRPFYVRANLVIVPTLESAGTNLKVLEAMAMARAVVSTPSGCDGLGLIHGRTVWLASTPQLFARGIEFLLATPPRRDEIARRSRAYAEAHFGWPALGERQRALWETLLEQKPRRAVGGKPK